MSQNNSGDGGGADNTVTPFRDVNAESSQRRIADDLRQARMARGLEVADAARILRIRAVYLAALEEGRFAELPGPTYVAGFLRAYGRFLDLDGDELVRRYKDESGGLIARQQLNFPVPASEARHPTGIMIVGGLVVALLVAGGWFVLKDRQWADLDLVPEVPAEMAQDAGEVAEETAPEPEIVVAEEELAAEVEEEAPAETGLAASSDEMSTDVVPPAEDEAAADEAEVAVTEEPAVETENTEAVAEEAMAEEAMAEDVAEDVAVVEADESADMAASEAELAADDGYVPRIYGRTNTDSRVEIRAVEETWIQVEGPDNEMLLTRVLLPGDIYRVPDRDDVTLDTGNAGGLELRVDGALIPSLGDPGIVIRNVSLAPDSLLSR